MNKYFLVSIFLMASFFLAGCGENGANEALSIDKNAEIIFFYGRECPHCKDVEKYIEDNNVAEKINFVQGEVYHNKSNAEFMVEKQKECPLADDMIGAVPFLWTKDKCYLGQVEIIEFLKSEINN